MTARSRVLVVLLVLAVATLAALLWTKHRSDVATDARRAEIEQVAGTGATALLHHDHEDLDRSVEMMQSVATPEFARAFEERFEAEVAPAIQRARAAADAEVAATWLPNQLTSPVEVVVEVATTIDASERSRTTRTHLLVTVVEDAGRWLVGDVAGLTIATEPDPAD